MDNNELFHVCLYMPDYLIPRRASRLNSYKIVGRLTIGDRLIVLMWSIA